MKEDQILARSQMYKLLSTSLSYPTRDIKNEINDVTFFKKLLEISEGLPEHDLKTPINDLKKTFDKYGNSLLKKIEAEYIALFENEDNDHSKIYELSYVKRPLFLKTGELADIAGFYRAFGLEVSENNRLRVDHISTELEFMHLLTFKESFAIQNGNSDDSKICRDAQKKFLTDHLGGWTSSFREKVNSDGNSPFYSTLSFLLAKFVAGEKMKLNINL